MEKYLMNLGRTGEFDFNKIKKIENHFMKPKGGVWCCRENTPEGYSWVDWCEREMPFWVTDKYARISISPESKIFIVDSEKSWNFLNSIAKRNFDFETWAEHYDMIDFRMSDFPELYYAFYGIDCDSCLIMNKNIITNVEQITIDNEIDNNLEEETLDDIISINSNLSFDNSSLENVDCGQKEIENLLKTLFKVDRDLVILYGLYNELIEKGFILRPLKEILGEEIPKSKIDDDNLDTDDIR